jgi:hypothetical protein
MPTLTAEQSFQLAQNYSAIAHETDLYRFRNFDSLSAAERATLEDRARSMRNFSSEFVAISITLDLDDLEGTLNNIEDATTRMRRAIERLRKIGNVINVLTAGITLAGAIIPGSPVAVLSALEMVVISVNEATHDEA